MEASTRCVKFRPVAVAHGRQLSGISSGCVASGHHAITRNGIRAYGFLRPRCGECGHDRRVAFRWKRACRRLAHGGVCGAVLGAPPALAVRGNELECHQAHVVAEGPKAAQVSDNLELESLLLTVRFGRPNLLSSDGYWLSIVARRVPRNSGCLGCGGLHHATGHDSCAPSWGSGSAHGKGQNQCRKTLQSYRSRARPVSPRRVPLSQFPCNAGIA